MFALLLSPVRKGVFPILLLLCAVSAGAELRISGAVIDNTSNPVPTALVRFIAEGDTVTTTSGADGTYSLVLSPIESGAGNEIPDAFRLLQNYPNPFNPTTVIGYVLEHAAPVRLDIYDITGRFVRRLAEGRQGAGIHSAAWNGLDERGRPVSAGVYFYRMTAGGFSETRKMLLLDGGSGQGSLYEKGIFAEPKSVAGSSALSCRVRVEKDGYASVDTTVPLVSETGTAVHNILVRKLLPPGITDEDMREIVGKTFITGVIEGKIADARFTRSGDLLNRNFDPAWILSDLGIKLAFLSRDEIQAKVDAHGDYLYFYIPPVSFENGKVLIGLQYIQAVSSVQHVPDLVGGGIRMEYTRVEGIWQGKITGGFII